MNKIFFFFSCMFGLVLYHWYNNKNNWQNTDIKKKIINWYGANTIALIKNNNNYDIKIFDIVNNNLLKLDDWNIQNLDLDKNFDQLKKLKNNNSVIYIIRTKMPINKLYNYLINSSLIIKNPFIIINTKDTSIIIHNFFFNKSKKDNDYIQVPFLNLNQLNISCISNYINTYYKDLEFYVLYGNNDDNVNNNIVTHFQNITNNK